MKLSGQDLKILEAILNFTLKATLKDMRTWIAHFVPKRTGQLRFTLNQNMKSSWVSKGILRMILGTHVDYAKDVNKMTTSQVRHHSGREHRKKGQPKRWAYAYYWKHHGRIFLNDPQAIGHFYDKMLIYLKARVLINLTAAQKQFLGKHKLNLVVA